jgi:hypothetical protein
MVDQGKTWINQNQPGNNLNHEAYQNPQHPTTSYNSYVPSMSARSRSPAVTVAGTGGALKSMWNFLLCPTNSFSFHGLFAKEPFQLCPSPMF